MSRSRDSFENTPSSLWHYARPLVTHAHPYSPSTVCIRNLNILNLAKFGLVKIIVLLLLPKSKFLIHFVFEWLPRKGEAALFRGKWMSFPRMGMLLSNATWSNYQSSERERERDPNPISIIIPSDYLMKDVKQALG